MFFHPQHTFFNIFILKKRNFITITRVRDKISMQTFYLPWLDINNVSSMNYKSL